MHEIGRFDKFFLWRAALSDMNGSVSSLKALFGSPSISRLILFVSRSILAAEGGVSLNFWRVTKTIQYLFSEPKARHQCHSLETPRSLT